MRFNQNPEIKSFIKDRLGCTCADNVFDEIDVVRIKQLADKQIDYHRLLVGNKLLIYLLKNIDICNLQTVLPLIVRAGKEERDTMKYNRFRLVLACEHLRDMEKPAYSIFESIAEKDEKIHLHLVTRNEASTLSGILEQRAETSPPKP